MIQEKQANWQDKKELERLNGAAERNSKKDRQRQKKIPGKPSATRKNLKRPMIVSWRNRSR
ncbi:MAG: hypothetical protein IPO69_16055 [Saprospiraceae bacterium]|nr:hypothetical protein [Saprospiraceae bacterium]